MEHLGVELYGPNRLSGRSESGISNVLCATDNLEIARDSGDGITMAHPHLRTLLEALEQRVVEIDGLKIGTSVLAAIGLFNLTTKCVRDELSAIANAQYGQTANKLAEVYLERLRVVY